MTVTNLLKFLTPSPWMMIDRRRHEQGIQIESMANLDSVSQTPVICHLTETDWQMNGQLIATAPNLLTCLYLALQALEQPELRRMAHKRGYRALEQAVGCAQIEPDPIVRQLLSEIGIVEPTLSELALTTTSQLTQAWIRYAQQHNLGNGFIVTQLRAGTHPRYPQPKRWFTEAERQQFFAT